MTFDGAGGVSVVELIVYFPALVIAIFVCSRHGFGRSSGWIYTMILCLVRIVGACCQLATYKSQSTGLLEADLILESVGISPLLLATLGLLSRCADSINQSSRTVFSAMHFRIIQLCILIGLILSIAGGTSSVSSTGVYKSQTTSKAGIALYLVCFLALCIVTMITLKNSSYLMAGENRLIWAVIIAMPLILIRLIYSLLIVFHHSHTFSLINGSALVHALMAVVEEMLVVLMYLGVGWSLSTDSATMKAPGPIASRPWKGSGAATGGGAMGVGRRGNGGRRQGPIHALVGMAVSGAQNRGGNDRNATEGV
ncbi:hypothetical protein LTR15_009488 [Elasticomyces elasticus]|nr:hypothetical protein LTR15_009488 [Elasticomyces elasticus]